jgi:hypothetical protein
MTLLAMIFCKDPALLAQRQCLLAARLQRHADLKLIQTPMADGALLVSQRQEAGLHHAAQIEGDFFGRFGWSRVQQAVSGVSAQQRFEAAKQTMPAMSGLWCWEPVAGRLHLATDSLGARPFFYAQSGGCITVSSALWLLESCPWIKTSLDEPALHQRLLLGYCLDGATPYKSIRRVQGGTHVQLRVDRQASPSVRRWHRWDAVATDNRSLDTQLDEIHACFMQAILDQDDGAAVPVAALSGGLDTRVVIAGLLAEARRPACLTFTWRNSLDGAIAAQFAAAASLEARVIDVPRPLDAPFLIKSARALGADPVRLWTGYGGSVGAGYVHSNSQIIAQARAGNMRKVAQMLLQAKGASVSKFLFGAARAKYLTAELEAAVTAALEAQTPDDLGRRIQLYLLQHQEPEQLRPLTENADSLGMDVAAPFYNVRLLEKWLAVPLDLAIYHKAYVAWLQRLPAVVTAVPWQAYPGHVKSPKPLPMQADQWADQDALYHRQQSLNDLAFVRKCEVESIPAASSIDRWRQWSARGAVAMGRYRHSYLLRLAASYAAFEQHKGVALLDHV